MTDNDKLTDLELVAHRRPAGQFDVRVVLEGRTIFAESMKVAS